MSRLSNLEDAYNELVRINFDFSQFPNTSKYYKYYLWKTDPEQRELPEGSAQNQGTKKKVGLQPFGRPIDTSKTVVRMSGRAFTAVGTLPENARTSLGHETTDFTGYRTDGSYKPAKVILANKLTNPVAVPKADNRITGRAYKKRTGETFTVPFGRIAAVDTEFDAQDVIIQAVADNYAATFVPEKLIRRVC